MASDSLPPPEKHFEEQFGVTRALMLEMLSRALDRGGDHAELFFQHSRRASIGLEDGEVNRASAGVDLGVGVRVTQGDQTGYAFTESLDRGSMLETAAVASTIAEGGPTRPPAELSVEVHADRYPPRDWGAEPSVEARIPTLQRLNHHALRADPRVRKVRARLSDEETTILIVDALGRLHADRQPMAVISLSCTAEHQGRVEEDHESFSARTGADALDARRLDELVQTCVERAIRGFEARKPTAGEMAVVLAAGGSGILLHEAIGHGMEADFNRKGTSVYSDSVGRSIAAPFVSIVDDATVEGSRGALNVDDEGTAGQHTVLVDGGVLTGYLHDRISAAHYRVPLTGSGRRQSFRHSPHPRMSNTYMLGGPHSRDEIIASVERGVICESFTNGQVNIGPGDFTFYVKTGYLIEGGRVTAPVKDFNIIGNGPEVLSRVTMVADDLALDDSAWSCGKEGQSVPVSLGMPTCLVSSITVGGVD